MIIIGARPSTGKTSIMLNLASAILRKGKTVGIFSAEMDASQLIERMVSDWGSIDSTRLRSGLLSREDSARITCACTELAAKKLFLNDTPNVSLQDIECSGSAMRMSEKADILMVDYLSLVTNDRKDIPRHEQMAEVSRRLKGLARNLGIPIVVLSQLTRDSEGVRPSLSKLRESGALEQDADIVILLNRMEAESSGMYVELLVEKNRNGPTGKVETIFASSLMRFREIQAKDLGLEGGATAARYPHGKKSA
jgi:replicative DNA helicase